LREALEGERIPPPAYYAGHSVGELAALAAAGAIDFETTLRLVTQRSRLMAEACERVDGAMAAVLQTDEAGVRSLCAEASQATATLVQLANLNAPGQLVVSGHRQAIQWLMNDVPGDHPRRPRAVKLLRVGGPFHSRYMDSAGAAFAEVLAETPIQVPTRPVVLNQSARPTCDPEEIRRELSEQISAPVRWTESIQLMANAGCTLFLEIGPGNVLAGLVHRTLPDAQVISVNDASTLERAATALRAAGGCDGR
jgi:[acyl-carrier-protein] S-malonyltransferase